MPWITVKQRLNNPQTQILYTEKREGKKMTLKQICKAAGFASIDQMSAVSGIPQNYLFRVWQADEKQVAELVAVYAPYIPCGNMGGTLVSLEFNDGAESFALKCFRKNMVKALSSNGFDRQQIVAVLMAGHEREPGHYAELSATGDIDGWDIINDANKGDL
jgi:hypothetical protein